LFTHKNTIFPFIKAFFTDTKGQISKGEERVIVPDPKSLYMDYNMAMKSNYYPSKTLRAHSF